MINNIKVLSEDGGFVFSAVHNIQANTPENNLKMLFDTFQQWRDCKVIKNMEREE